MSEKKKYVYVVVDHPCPQCWVRDYHYVFDSYDTAIRYVKEKMFWRAKTVTQKGDKRNCYIQLHAVDHDPVTIWKERLRYGTSEEPVTNLR